MNNDYYKNNKKDKKDKNNKNNNNSNNSSNGNNSNNGNNNNKNNNSITNNTNNTGNENIQDIQNARNNTKSEKSEINLNSVNNSNNSNNSNNIDYTGSVNSAGITDKDIDIIVARKQNKTGLTSREKEVLRLVVRGLNNREIGKVLNISSHTAKAHVCSLLYKLNVKNRLNAAMWAMTHLSSL